MHYCMYPPYTRMHVWSDFKILYKMDQLKHEQWTFSEHAAHFAGMKRLQRFNWMQTDWAHTYIFIVYTFFFFFLLYFFLAGAVMMLSKLVRQRI